MLDRVIQEQAIRHLLVAVAEPNGNACNTVYAKTMKVAANQVECVLDQAAGAVKTITKVVKIGGHGVSNMVLHGVQQFDHNQVIHNQDLILNSIRGMTYMICKVADQLVDLLI